MQLSVIILNYNVHYFLQLCLQSVEAAIQGLDAEIIVVDNNSQDSSCVMVKEQFSNVKLIENKEWEFGKKILLINTGGLQSVKEMNIKLKKKGCEIIKY